MIRPAIASLVANSSQLPRQPLTSHPSVKEQLDKGRVRVHPFRQPLSQGSFPVRL